MAWQSKLTNGNVVVVVNHDKVAELQVTGSRGGLGGNTLLGATIAEKAVGVVVNEVEAGLVEDGSGVCLGNGKTDGVTEALTEGTSGDLNSGSVVCLGVSRGDGVEGLLWVRCGRKWYRNKKRLTLKALMSSMETA